MTCKKAVYFAADQVMLSEIVQTVRDFQGLIGSFTGAVVGVLLTLFVTRRSSEGGPVYFHISTFEARVWRVLKEEIVPKPGAAGQTETHRLIADDQRDFQNAWNARVVASFDIYNSSNVRKAIRALEMALTYRARGRRRSVAIPARDFFFKISWSKPYNVEPKETLSAVFEVHLGQESTRLVREHNPTLVLDYRDQKNRRRSCVLGKLEDNPALSFLVQGETGAHI